LGVDGADFGALGKTDLGGFRQLGLALQSLNAVLFLIDRDLARFFRGGFLLETGLARHSITYNGIVPASNSGFQSLVAFVPELAFGG
jgi:hypothetical protein